MDKPKKSKLNQNLTSEEYSICWEKGTEKPFSGKYWNLKDPGTYSCLCCGAPIFLSDDKYDSGTGWPSFKKPMNQNALKSVKDYSHGMERVEVTCSQCGAHLGHVFGDGPAPTGQRYCINSAAMKFKPKDKT